MYAKQCAQLKLQCFTVIPSQPVTEKL